jgi:hypothetical protein
VSWLPIVAIGRTSVTRLRRLSSAIAIVAVIAGPGTSCSSCEAKCVGPGAEFFVSSDVGSVEVCDSTGTCTTRMFGSGSRTFVVPTNHERDVVRLDIRTFLADGTSGVSGRVEATPPGGGADSCGCKGLVRIDVSASKIAST